MSRSSILGELDRMVAIPPGWELVEGLLGEDFWEFREVIRERCIRVLGLKGSYEASMRLWASVKDESLGLPMDPWIVFVEPV
jgi:hypothetical protein